MNANEGVSLTKMAIAAMLVCLVIGATFTLWYLLSDNANEIQRDMQDAARSASAEKLYSLQEQSMTADKLVNAKDVLAGHPLVTNVINCLSEFNEDGLLYIYIVVQDKSGTYRDPILYTYDGLNVNLMAKDDEDANGFGLPGYGSGAGVTKVSDSNVPVTQACKTLMSFTQYRCHLTIYDAKYGTSGNTSYMGLSIEIIETD